MPTVLMLILFVGGSIGRGPSAQMPGMGDMANMAAGGAAAMTDMAKGFMGIIPGINMLPIPGMRGPNPGNQYFAFCKQSFSIVWLSVFQ